MRRSLARIALALAFAFGFYVLNELILLFLGGNTRLFLAFVAGIGWMEYCCLRKDIERIAEQAVRDVVARKQA